MLQNFWKASLFNIMKKRIKVVIFIFTSGSKVLIEKRSLENFEGLQYLVPGGGVKDLEDIEEALKRELKEELGITPIDFTPIPSSDIYGLQNQLLLLFLINSWEGEIPEIVLDKGNPLVWLEIDEILKTPIRSTREVIEAFKKYRETNDTNKT